MSKKKITDKTLVKGRVWAFVLYPESCIDYIDMIDKLKNLGVPMAVSPLHIPDKNIEQENEKKPHYHCLMYFDGQKNNKELKKLLDMSSTSYDRQYFNWQLLCDKKNLYSNVAKYPYFLKVNSIRSQFRYLLHLDNPLKQQFNDYKIQYFVVDDEQKYNTLVLLNGFNEKDYLKCSGAHPLYEILQIVKDNKFKGISQLLEYLADNRNEYLISYIQHNMYFLSKFVLADLMPYYKNSQVSTTTTSANIEH